MKDKLKQYKGYLIDLDGTMYRGTERIEAASDFVKKLCEADIPHLFVTNNSSKRPEQVKSKLNEMDIPAELDQIFTTSMATAKYIKQEKAGATVYAIGEEGIVDALKNEELTFVEENADYVVMGIDRNITYEKLATACLNVRAGATFISTNSDIAIPTERGMLPGNGSLTSVVAVSTGVSPIFIGKPEAIIMEQAIKTLGLPKEDIIMVGDNYNTDIMAGINAHLDTVLVFTGVTIQDHLQEVKEQPTYTIQSLQEWIRHL